MHFTKPALTIDDQVALLRSRGMEGDPSRIARRLSVVNYYRLSGYWYPFRILENDHFRPGTHIDEVWNRYMFDRKLRLLVMDAIERIEVSVRTQVAYKLATEFGAFGYYDKPESLPLAVKPSRNELMEWIQKDVSRSREPFIDHFNKKYGDEHGLPPIWMATEVLSFGTVVALYRKSPKTIQKQIANQFGVADVVFESWILTLNTVRNYCAHHSRLYNRVLTLRPKLPRINSLSDWHDPFSISNDRLFCILTIYRHIMLRIAPNSRWSSRLVDLVEKHPNIPLDVMGMPPNWREHALWRDV